MLKLVVFFLLIISNFGNCGGKKNAFEKEIRLGKFGLSFIEKTWDGALQSSRSGPTANLLANCSVPICEGPLSSIYCSGPMIASAWYFGVRITNRSVCPGSKLRFHPQTVLDNFNKLLKDKSIKKEEFLQFCNENFENLPYLVEANLSDWKPAPSKFNKINDARMKKFAKTLHGIWPNLTRTFRYDVFKNMDKYRVLPVPNKFIVPGGRFQIYFYWDSYWILKGMYFSELYETARGIIENFAHILKLKGFIPNSGNIELSRRSQPPFFTQMVADYYEQTQDKDFLRQQLLNSEQELSWWRNNRSIQFSSNENNSNIHILYQFKSITNCPRPENLIEDYELGSKFENVYDSRFFWSSTTSACESGLDFSSRWFAEKNESSNARSRINRKFTETNNILPVDLNVLMAQNYRTLSHLYGSVLNEKKKSKMYGMMADKLANSIEEVFFDKNDGVWFDYDLNKRELRKKFYPSNIFPLHLKSNSTLKRCRSVLTYLNKIDVLNFKGGVPSSLAKNSAEQWDYPNGWAPSMHLFVKSLMICVDFPNALIVGKKIADRLLRTGYNGLFNPKNGRVSQMWEKYDVRFDDGTPGFGGEYPPQRGFGWTNGVVLEFIRMFYTNKTAVVLLDDVRTKGYSPLPQIRALEHSNQNYFMLLFQNIFSALI